MNVDLPNVQVSDARVGPRKVANSHYIPCCPTLSKATICQTILEGRTPKRCSGVEKSPVSHMHACLNGRFGKIYRFLPFFGDFAHFFVARNISFYGS